MKLKLTQQNMEILPTNALFAFQMAVPPTHRMGEIMKPIAGKSKTSKYSQPT